MTIHDFCKKYRACKEGREWATALGLETMEELWSREDMNPKWRVWIALHKNVLADRELRLLSDDRSRRAIEIAERYANGDATAAELADAYDAASYASAYATATKQIDDNGCYVGVRGFLKAHNRMRDEAERLVNRDLDLTAAINDPQKMRLEQ